MDTFHQGLLNRQLAFQFLMLRLCLRDVRADLQAHISAVDLNQLIFQLKVFLKYRIVMFPYIIAVFPQILICTKRARLLQPLKNFITFFTDILAAGSELLLQSAIHIHQLETIRI